MLCSRRCVWLYHAWVDAGETLILERCTVGSSLQYTRRITVYRCCPPEENFVAYLSLTRPAALSAAQVIKHTEHILVGMAWRLGGGGP